MFDFEPFLVKSAPEACIEYRFIEVVSLTSGNTLMFLHPVNVSYYLPPLMFLHPVNVSYYSPPLMFLHPVNVSYYLPPLIFREHSF